MGKRPARSRRRERIDLGTHKRYVRRASDGTFTGDQVEVGRSLSADRRQRAKRTVRKGFGGRGDQKRRKK